MGSEPGRKVAKIVFARSGDRCAMQDCRKPLVLDRTSGGDSEVLIGKIAHIAGNNPSSARYDKAMSDDERNMADNLMAVCPTCHDRIDAQTRTYTTEKLHKIKEDHEAWVRETLEKNLHEITFPELDKVISRVITMFAEPDGLHAIVPVIKLHEKIVKNKMSAWTEDLIGIGLTRVNTVANCINESADATLSDRLKAGMVREYRRLRNTGWDGDELFDAMWKITGKNHGAKQSAAGLAVLVYFFEACEVFER